MELKQLQVYLKNAVSLVEGAMQAEERSIEATKQAKAAEDRRDKADAKAKEMEATATRKIQDALTQAEQTKANAEKQTQREVEACRKHCDDMVAGMKEESAKTVAKLKTDKAKLAELQTKIEEAGATIAKLDRLIEEGKKDWAKIPG